MQCDFGHSGQSYSFFSLFSKYWPPLSNSSPVIWLFSIFILIPSRDINKFILIEMSSSWKLTRVTFPFASSLCMSPFPGPLFQVYISDHLHDAAEGQYFTLYWFFFQFTTLYYKSCGKTFIVHESLALDQTTLQLNPCCRGRCNKPKYMEYTVPGLYPRA